MDEEPRRTARLELDPSKGAADATEGEARLRARLAEGEARLRAREDELSALARRFLASEAEAVAAREDAARARRSVRRLKRAAFAARRLAGELEIERAARQASETAQPTAPDRSRTVAWEGHARRLLTQARRALGGFRGR